MESWIKYAAAITALGAALGVLYRYLIRPLRAAHCWYKEVMEDVGAVSDIKTTLDEVLMELRPNGGKSLSDRLEHLREGFETYTATQRALHEWDEQAFVRCNPRGEVIWANRSALDLMGMNFDEALGNGWINAYPRSDQVSNMELWRDAVAQRRGLRTVGRFVHRSGVTVYHEVQAEPVIGRGGQLLGWVSLISPLTAEEFHARHEGG
jgi:PAS domain S-box-containing protein